MEPNYNGFGPYPINSSIYLADVFTPEECQQIIKIGSEHWVKNDGGIGNNWLASNDEDKHIDNNIRTTTIYAVDPTEFDKKFELREFQEWLFKKIMNEVMNTNLGNEYFPGWKFDISGFLENPQLMIYESSRNGHYEWHIDIGPYEPACKRKIAYTLILNSKDEYDGGDLLFKLDKDDYHREFYDIGGMIMFPTYMLHKVTPVTRGNRYTLVGWIHGNQPFR